MFKIYKRIGGGCAIVGTVVTRSIGMKSYNVLFIYQIVSSITDFIVDSIDTWLGFLILDLRNGKCK